MGRRIKKYFLGIIQSFIFLLFVGYYAGITMFYHTHNVNGQLITHSHPFVHDKSNKSPFESHSHSSSEYSLIQQLNETNWDKSSDIVQLPEPIRIAYEYCSEYISHDVCSTNQAYSQLRAPPIS